MTPRLERVLHQAAELANGSGYNYLGIEHVVLAALQDENSTASAPWGEGALTREEFIATLTESLPQPPINPGLPVTVRSGAGRG